VIKRILLAGIAVGALIGAASAADLPVAPRSYYPGVTPVPYYNWSGFYLGGNAGGDWANVSPTVALPLGTLGTVGGTISSSSSGFAGGGQIGYNWFFAPSYIVGIEGDFEALTNDHTGGAPDLATYETKLQYLSTARARFGLAADRFMFFLTGGFAWSQGQNTRTNNGSAFAPAGTVETKTIDRTGWTAGAGVEYAIASNWTLRLEYLYASLSGNSYTLPVSGIVISPGTLAVNEFRFGVNFKFGPGDPVVGARY